MSQATDQRRPRGVSQDGGRYQGQLEQADDDPDHLDPAIAAPDHEKAQGGGGRGHGEPRRQARQLPGAGYAGELGDQRADAGHEECQPRKQGPVAPEVPPDQRPVTLAGEDPEANGAVLDDIEDGNEGDLGQHQPVAPLGTRLGRGDQAAGVGVGQHDHQPRPEHGGEAQPAPAVVAAGFREERLVGHRGAGMTARAPRVRHRHDLKDTELDLFGNPYISLPNRQPPGPRAWPGGAHELQEGQVPQNTTSTGSTSLKPCCCSGGRVRPPTPATTTSRREPQLTQARW